MNDCIFCKIIAKQIPCSKVYEDERVLCFLDLNPVTEGHTLVVPKTHSATLLDLHPGTGDSIMQAMRRVGKALMREVGAGGFNCLQNNFSVAGQEVPHLHWHVIPRHKAGELFSPWPAGKYDSLEHMNGLAEKLNTLILMDGVN